MYTGGFILPASILDEKVPDTFIEAQGTFREYLREWHVKDGKVLFHLNRGNVYYYPSQVEIELWQKYFGIDNFVDYFKMLNEFNPQKDEEIN